MLYAFPRFRLRGGFASCWFRIFGNRLATTTFGGNDDSGDQALFCGARRKLALRIKRVGADDGPQGANPHRSKRVAQAIFPNAGVERERIGHACAQLCWSPGHAWCAITRGTARVAQRGNDGFWLGWRLG